jgi:hypothetical protein
MEMTSVILVELATKRALARSVKSIGEQEVKENKKSNHPGGIPHLTLT